MKMTRRKAGIIIFAMTSTHGGRVELKSKDVRNDMVEFETGGSHYALINKVLYEMNFLGKEVK
jgi:hypothetical protein